MEAAPLWAVRIMENTDLGVKINDAASGKDYSIATVAHLVGMKSSHLYHIIAGEKRLLAKLSVRIAKVLDLDARELCIMQVDLDLYRLSEEE